jgi:hypothetical protein
LLADILISCAAEKYNLPELKRLALRKQGLQSGIQCSTILSSARYAYANTPDTDSKLRAHYLALIIRSRSTFKRSGTMQMEMEHGGKLFFDLFVAMCNHMVRTRTPMILFPSILMMLSSCRMILAPRASLPSPLSPASHHRDSTLLYPFRRYSLLRRCRTPLSLALRAIIASHIMLGPISFCRCNHHNQHLYH